MKKIIYLILGGLITLFAAGCADNNGSTGDDEEYAAGSATLRLAIVDEATRQPLPGVSVKHVLLKISETTGDDGLVTIHLPRAPRALVGLEFSHEVYDTYATSIAIGEVAEGASKEVNATIGLNLKSVNYVATLNVVDDSTFFPVQGMAILGLPTGSDGTNAEGSVEIRFPGPGAYDLSLAHPDYDTLAFRVQVPDEGLPGETIRVDLGTLAVTILGGFRVIEVNLAGEYTTQIIEASRNRGAIFGTILTKSGFMNLDPSAFEWSWDRRADFSGTDFDYAFSASGTQWCYPLCFKLYYEESPYAEGCYRVEVVAFLEPFSPSGNHSLADESYYDYKKKQLVLHFEMYESWDGTTGWDTYILTFKE
ncbi:MAG: hypothetical protein LBK12_08725 [Odoribacteraceae bacterium]|jgi:hypothetical protein|nr:hypothetical protein [Odoribacteraceae bacterium]